MCDGMYGVHSYVSNVFVVERHPAMRVLIESLPIPITSKLLLYLKYSKKCTISTKHCFFVVVNEDTFLTPGPISYYEQNDSSCLQRLRRECPICHFIPPCVLRGLCDLQQSSRLRWK